MKDETAAVFERNRQTLEGIAYRMLGSLADARDVVQETYLKWRATDAGTIATPRAWLITVCSRLALNRLKSARTQREIYVGEWLPEPFPDPDADPSRQVELDNTVSVALLLALEKLSPAERAAFLLHDVFDLSLGEIARVIGKSSANCRQLAARARRRIHDERPRFHATPEEHIRLLEGFIGASRRGDLERLISMLADDVELHTDGGGKVEAPTGMLRGSKPVARFFTAIFHRHALQAVFQRFNGSPGVLLLANGKLTTVLTMDAHAGRIHRLYAVRNPDKFSGFAGRDL